MKCKFCENLEDLDREYHDEPHHGANLYHEECGAEYYEEYGTENIFSCNKQAKLNHPELQSL